MVFNKNTAKEARSKSMKPSQKRAMRTEEARTAQGLQRMEFEEPQMEIDEPPVPPPIFGPAMPTAEQMNEALLQRIRELEEQVHALKAELNAQNAIKNMLNTMQDKTPPRPKTHYIFKSPIHQRSADAITKQALSKRIMEEAKRLQKRHRIEPGTPIADKFGRALHIKLRRGLPSPQKNTLRLTPEEDLWICLKSGISWNSRRVIKRELIKKRLDVFGPSTAMEKIRKEIMDWADYEWSGAIGNRVMTCKNVKEVMERRIVDLAESNKLKIRKEGKLTIVLTGDKGGTQSGTKIGLILADVEKPNSPSNITIVGYYEADDNRQNMQARLGPLFDQLKCLTKIGTYDVEWMVCADYKFLCSLMGHQGASSRYPCLLCLSKQRNHEAYPVGQRICGDICLFVDCMAGSVQYRNREWNTSTQNSIEWRSA